MEQLGSEVYKYLQSIEPDIKSTSNFNAPERYSNFLLSTVVLFSHKYNRKYVRFLKEMCSHLSKEANCAQFYVKK